MALVAALLGGIALVGSCTLNRNPHDDEGAVFELVGVHAAIECEACHGDGPFESLPTDCVACHEEDRPRRHHGKQSCGNAGCHTPLGWLATGGRLDDDDDVVPTPTTDTDLPTTDTDTTVPTTPQPTTPTPTTTTPTGTVGHEYFPLVGVHDNACEDCHLDFPDTDTERIVCRDCHEEDRRDAYHYVGQDCAHCHPMESGWANPTEHEFLLPHGIGTVEECLECHPDIDDRAGNFVCTDCHEQAETDADHQIFQDYQFESTACVGCHPDGA
jgi:hypothetical protein